MLQPAPHKALPWCYASKFARASLLQFLDTISKYQPIGELLTLILLLAFLKFIH